MLIFLVGVVTLGYNQICSQILSFFLVLLGYLIKNIGSICPQI